MTIDCGHLASSISCRSAILSQPLEPVRWSKVAQCGQTTHTTQCARKSPRSLPSDTSLGMAPREKHKRWICCSANARPWKRGHRARGRAEAEKGGGQDDAGGVPTGPEAATQTRGPTIMSLPRHASHHALFCRRCSPTRGLHRAALPVSPRGSGARRTDFGPQLPTSCGRGETQRSAPAGNEASIAAGRQRGHHPDDGHPSARGARPVNGAHDRSGRCRGSWRNEIAFNVSAGATREQDELASLEWRRRCGATGPTRTPVGPNNGHAGPSACSSREMGAQAGARWPLESIKAALPTVPSAPPPPPPTLTTARALHPHPHKGTRTAPTPAPHSAVVMVAGHPTHHLPRPTPSTPSSFPSWWCGRCLVATRSKCLSTL